MDAQAIQTVANIFTAAGVLVAARQLWITQRQTQSQFEDNLIAQYREISSKIPLEALLGSALTDDQLSAHLRGFYEYFDLSNEQALLSRKGRIRSETWSNWREGIDQHLARPAFRQAWSRLAPNLNGSFDDFKRLLPSDYLVSGRESTDTQRRIERQV